MQSSANGISRPLSLAMLLLAGAIPALAQNNLITDGNFSGAGSQMQVPLGDYGIFPITSIQSGSSPVVGWQTTASDGLVEIWGTGFLGVSAPEGASYFAELNAYEVSTLFQVVRLDEANPVSYTVAHRGRDGVDVMDIKVYHLGGATSWSPGLGTEVYSRRLSDGADAWGFYSDSNMFTPIAGDYYSFAFVSVSATGNPAIGNFLTDVQFGYDVAAVPEPSLGWLAGSLVLAGAAVARLRRRTAVR